MRDLIESNDTTTTDATVVDNDTEVTAQVAEEVVNDDSPGEGDTVENDEPDTEGETVEEVPSVEALWADAMLHLVADEPIDNEAFAAGVLAAGEREPLTGQPGDQAPV